MKQFFRKYIQIPALLLVVLAGVIQSCEDKDVGGVPVIENVRLLDPAKADSSISGGLPGIQIVIQGQNFSGLQKVYFNEFEAGFNTALNSDNNIIITIPGDAPTKAVQADVSNKIRVVTSGGEGVYDFSLTSPSPEIWDLHNEFAKPGSQLVIYGNYFYNINSAKLGTTNLEIVSKSVTKLVVKLPAVITTDFITIEGEFGKSTSRYKLNNPVGNIINFDIPATSWGSAVCWGAAEITDTLNPISGKYMRVKGVDLPKTSWNDSWALGTCGFDFQLAPGAAKDKVFKFEHNSKEAWKTGQLNIELKVGDVKYLYLFKPWNNPTYSTTGYKTDGWQTETIDLAEFLAGSSTIPDISKLSDVTIWFNTPDGGLEKFDGSFDNFRIVDK
jgi:hypothetical protein